MVKASENATKSFMDTSRSLPSKAMTPFSASRMQVMLRELAYDLPHTPAVTCWVSASR